MTDYLYTRPSFLSGFARALDLFGQYDTYNRAPTPDDADLRAHLADLLAVEGDMIAAYRTLLAHAQAEHAALQPPLPLGPDELASRP